MDMHAPKICLVSSSHLTGDSICERLANECVPIDWIQNTKQALDKIRNHEYDIVVSDISQPELRDPEFLSQLYTDIHNALPTFFIIEYGSFYQPKKSLNLSVSNHIFKALDYKSLIKKLKELCSNNSLNHPHKQQNTLGISSSMNHVDEKIKMLTPYTQTPVLIFGESGVGKEVVARRLHATQNSTGPFVAINCAAIPHSLIESELFGHEKGAFTGSTNMRKGVFEQANGGTLLLDEIGDMPLETQAKLLRVIQEKTVVRLGSNQDIPVNIRIICSTNSDLRAKVDDGEFREDLYYRINVIEINIPPLRKRQEDILFMAYKFLNIHSEKYSEKIKKLDGVASQALLEHSWPGNIRELKNTIERACIMTPGTTISAQDIFPKQSMISFEEKNKSLKSFIQAQERTYIEIILRENSWNMMNTARTLGICRKSLWEKMRKYDIKRPL